MLLVIETSERRVEYAVLEIDQLEFYKVGIPAGRARPERRDIREIRERCDYLVAVEIQLLMKLRMEHHDVLFLLGSEALVELVAVAVVEDIIALNAVFLEKSCLN